MRDIEDVLNEAREWFNTECKGLKELEAYTCGKLKDSLHFYATPFDAITSRTKIKDSFLNKVLKRFEDDSDDDFREIRDLVGLRVIVRVDSELKHVEEVIRRIFIVRKTKRKAKDLGRDRLGYRGTHFLVSATGSRKHAGLRPSLRAHWFEIQIRTLCEHAWSQINHPAYKIGEDKLEPGLEREINLLAGHLELADLRFNQLAAEIDSYYEEFKVKTEQPDKLLDFPIEGHSLKALVLAKLGKSHSGIRFGSEGEAETITSELTKFGFTDLNDLNRRFPWDSNTIQLVKFRSIAGLMRYGMIIRDQDLYKEKAWDGTWDIQKQLFHKFDKLKLDGVDVDKLPNKK